MWFFILLLIVVVAGGAYVLRVPLLAKLTGQPQDRIARALNKRKQ